MTSQQDQDSFGNVIGKRNGDKKRAKSVDQKKVHRQRQKQVKKARKADVQSLFNELVGFLPSVLARNPHGGTDGAGSSSIPVCGSMREPLPSHRNAPLVGRFRTCHMLAHLAAGSGLIFMVQQYEGTAPSTHTLWVSRFCSLTTGACLIQSAPQPALPWRFLFARAFHSRPAMGGFRPRPGVPPHTQIQCMMSFIISYPAKDQKELRKVTGRISPSLLKIPPFTK